MPTSSLPRKGSCRASGSGLSGGWARTYFFVILMHGKRRRGRRAAPAGAGIAAPVNELVEAAARADAALRAAQREPNVAAMASRPNTAPAATPAASGYAAMGIVTENTAGITDLNDVLRRRRAV